MWTCLLLYPSEVQTNLTHIYAREWTKTVETIKDWIFPTSFVLLVPLLTSTKHNLQNQRERERERERERGSLGIECESGTVYLFGSETKASSNEYMAFVMPSSRSGIMSLKLKFILI